MAEYTIDQLVHATGVPSSTIRMYGNRRLLAAPSRRGRVGYYDDTHVDRLAQISRLQGLGFSLAAIQSLIEASDRGDALGAVLGSETSEEPVRLSPAELADRFTSRPLTAESMQKAIAIGLVRFEGTDIVLDHPQFVHVGSSLNALGVSGDAILNEYESLRSATDAIAANFVALFETQLWDVAAADGQLAERAPELIEDLQRITPLAELMVRDIFNLSLRDAAKAFLNRHTSALAAQGVEVDPGLFIKSRPRSE